MVSFRDLDFRQTPVTLTVAALAVAIEVVCTLDPSRRDVFANVYKLGILSTIWSGEFWRPLTTTLLHGGPLHAAFNVYWVIIFGQLLERRWGSWRYLGLFVLLAYVSTLPQFLLSNLDTPLDAQRGMVGLSGVVYGLFGILWIGRQWKYEFRAVCSDETVWLLLFWLFACIGFTWFKIMNVANYAHGAGLLFGVLYGFAIYSPGRRRLWIVAATAASSLVLATMIAAPGHPLYEKYMEAISGQKPTIQFLPPTEHSTPTESPQDER